MTGCEVLFLVKNDSGLGHIRRAVVLSKALRRSGVSSVIVSQASSLVMFDDPELRVLNLPLMERLKSSAAEEAYAALLDAVVARLDPELVVEDTYPDRRYIGLPSLRGLPRVLVLRRLDPVAFEQVRRRGGFAHYDRVLVAQAREDFLAEPHTSATRRLVMSSGRFRFVGPVFHEPTPQEVSAVLRRYQVGEQPLVVVNAGSGGDQLNDAFADRLFTNARRIANTCLRQGLSARFVLVLGPYYRGRQLEPGENVDVVEFEPRLAALLRLASVAVVRPGHNVVHEALGGPAQLVLVPGIPWMEGQPEFARRLATRVGASVVDVDDYQTLERAVIGALQPGVHHPAACHSANATEAMAAMLANELDKARQGPHPARRGRMLVINPPEKLALRASSIVHDVCPEVPVVEHGQRPGSNGLSALVPLSRLVQGVRARADELPTDRDVGIYVDIEMPAGVDPSELRRLGAQMVAYTDEGDVGMRMRTWLAFCGSTRPEIVDVPLQRLAARPGRTRHLGWVLARDLEGDDRRGWLLDCSQLSEADFRTYLGDLRYWLDRLSIDPLPMADAIGRRVWVLYGQEREGSSAAEAE